MDLNGTGQDMSLSDLQNEINSNVSGVTAAISSTGQLTLTSNSPENEQFSFANDTSHILAALGLNTFFTGTSAQGPGREHGCADRPRQVCR